MSIVGSIIGAGTNLVGGIINNNANKDIARDASNANFIDSQRNRDFQRYMTENQHQIQKTDLEKAGLNPLLAAQSGAGGVSGAQGSAVTATMNNPAEGVVASAIEAKQLALQMEKQKEEIKNMKANKQLMKSATYKNSVEANVRSKDIPKADLINTIYDQLKPLITKGKKAYQSGAKSFNTNNRRP